MLKRIKPKPSASGATIAAHSGAVMITQTVAVGKISSTRLPDGRRGRIDDRVPQHLIKPRGEFCLVAQFVGTLQRLDQAVLQDVLRIRFISDPRDQERFELRAAILQFGRKGGRLFGGHDGS